MSWRTQSVKVKKPKKVARSKAATKKKTGAKVARKAPARAPAREQKYSQPGAPWWKPYLP